MKITRKPVPTEKRKREYLSDIALYTERVQKATKEYWKALGLASVPSYSNLSDPEGSLPKILSIAKKHNIKPESLAYCLYQKRGLELISNHSDH